MSGEFLGIFSEIYSITMFVPCNIQFNYDRKDISSKKNLITASEIVNIFSCRKWNC